MGKRSLSKFELETTTVELDGTEHEVNVVRGFAPFIASSWWDFFRFNKEKRKQHAVEVSPKFELFNQKVDRLAAIDEHTYEHLTHLVNLETLDSHLVALYNESYDGIRLRLGKRPASTEQEATADPYEKVNALDTLKTEIDTFDQPNNPTIGTLRDLARNHLPALEKLKKEILTLRAEITKIRATPTAQQSAAPTNAVTASIHDGRDSVNEESLFHEVSERYAHEYDTYKGYSNDAIRFFMGESLNMHEGFFEEEDAFLEEQRDDFWSTELTREFKIKYPTEVLDFKQDEFKKFNQGLAETAYNRIIKYSVGKNLSMATFEQYSRFIKDNGAFNVYVLERTQLDDTIKSLEGRISDIKNSKTINVKEKRKALSQLMPLKAHLASYKKDFRALIETETSKAGDSILKTYLLNYNTFFLGAGNVDDAHIAINNADRNNPFISAAASTGITLEKLYKDPGALQMFKRFMDGKKSDLEAAIKGANWFRRHIFTKQYKKNKQEFAVVNDFIAKAEAAIANQDIGEDKTDLIRVVVDSPEMSVFVAHNNQKNLVTGKPLLYSASTAFLLEQRNLYNDMSPYQDLDFLLALMTKYDEYLTVNFNSGNRTLLATVADGKIKTRPTAAEKQDDIRARQKVFEALCKAQKNSQDFDNFYSWHVEQTSGANSLDTRDHRDRLFEKYLRMMKREVATYAQENIKEKTLADRLEDRFDDAQADFANMLLYHAANKGNIDELNGYIAILRFRESEKAAPDAAVMQSLDYYEKLINGQALGLALTAQQAARVNELLYRIIPKAELDKVAGYESMTELLISKFTYHHYRTALIDKENHTRSQLPQLNLDEYKQLLIDWTTFDIDGQYEQAAKEAVGFFRAMLFDPQQDVAEDGVRGAETFVPRLTREALAGPFNAITPLAQKNLLAEHDEVLTSRKRNSPTVAAASSYNGRHYESSAEEFNRQITRCFLHPAQLQQLDVYINEYLTALENKVATNGGSLCLKDFVKSNYFIVFNSISSAAQLSKLARIFFKDMFKLDINTVMIDWQPNQTDSDVQTLYWFYTENQRSIQEAVSAVVANYINGPAVWHIVTSASILRTDVTINNFAAYTAKRIREILAHSNISVDAKPFDSAVELVGHINGLNKYAILQNHRTITLALSGNPANAKWTKELDYLMSQFETSDIAKKHIQELRISQIDDFLVGGDINGAEQFINYIFSEYAIHQNVTLADDLFTADEAHLRSENQLAEIFKRHLATKLTAANLANNPQDFEKNVLLAEKLALSFDKSGLFLDQIRVRKLELVSQVVSKSCTDKSFVEAVDQTKENKVNPYQYDFPASTEGRTLLYNFFKEKLLDNKEADNYKNYIHAFPLQRVIFAYDRTAEKTYAVIYAITLMQDYCNTSNTASLDDALWSLNQFEAALGSELNTFLLGVSQNSSPLNAMLQNSFLNPKDVTLPNPYLLTQTKERFAFVYGNKNTKKQAVVARISFLFEQVLNQPELELAKELCASLQALYGRAPFLIPKVKEELNNPEQLNRLFDYCLDQPYSLAIEHLIEQFDNQGDYLKLYHVKRFNELFRDVDATATVPNEDWSRYAQMLTNDDPTMSFHNLKDYFGETNFDQNSLLVKHKFLNIGDIVSGYVTKAMANFDKYRESDQFHIISRFAYSKFLPGDLYTKWIAVHRSWEQVRARDTSLREFSLLLRQKEFKKARAHFNRPSSDSLMQSGMKDKFLEFFKTQVALSSSMLQKIENEVQGLSAPLTESGRISDVTELLKLKLVMDEFASHPVKTAFAWLAKQESKRKTLTASLGPDRANSFFHYLSLELDNNNVARAEARLNEFYGYLNLGQRDTLCDYTKEMIKSYHTLYQSSLKSRFANKVDAVDLEFNSNLVLQQQYFSEIANIVRSTQLTNSNKIKEIFYLIEDELKGASAEILAVISNLTEEQVAQFIAELNVSTDNAGLQEVIRDIYNTLYATALENVLSSIKGITGSTDSDEQKFTALISELFFDETLFTLHAQQDLSKAVNSYFKQNTPSIAELLVKINNTGSTGEAAIFPGQELKAMAVSVMQLCYAERSGRLNGELTLASSCADIRNILSTEMFAHEAYEVKHALQPLAKIDEKSHIAFTFAKAKKDFVNHTMALSADAQFSKIKQNIEQINEQYDIALAALTFPVIRTTTKESNVSKFWLVFDDQQEERKFNRKVNSLFNIANKSFKQEMTPCLFELVAKSSDSNGKFTAISLRAYIQTLSQQRKMDFIREFRDIKFTPAVSEHDAEAKAQVKEYFKLLADFTEDQYLLTILASYSVRAVSSFDLLVIGLDQARKIDLLSQLNASFNSAIESKNYRHASHLRAMQAFIVGDSDAKKILAKEEEFSNTYANDLSLLEDKLKRLFSVQGLPRMVDFLLLSKDLLGLTLLNSTADGSASVPQLKGLAQYKAHPLAETWLKPVIQAVSGEPSLLVDFASKAVKEEGISQFKKRYEAYVAVNTVLTAANPLHGVADVLPFFEKYKAHPDMLIDYNGKSLLEILQNNYIPKVLAVLKGNTLLEIKPSDLYSATALINAYGSEQDKQELAKLVAFYSCNLAAVGGVHYENFHQHYQQLTTDQQALVKIAQPTADQLDLASRELLNSRAPFVNELFVLQQVLSIDYLSTLPNAKIYAIRNVALSDSLKSIYVSAQLKDLATAQQADAILNTFINGIERSLKDGNVLTMEQKQFASVVSTLATYDGAKRLPAAFKHQVSAIESAKSIAQDFMAMCSAIPHAGARANDLLKEFVNKHFAGQIHRPWMPCFIKVFNDKLAKTIYKAHAIPTGLTTLAEVERYLCNILVPQRTLNRDLSDSAAGLFSSRPGTPRASSGSPEDEASVTSRHSSPVSVGGIFAFKGNADAISLNGADASSQASSVPGTPAPHGRRSSVSHG